MLLHFPFSRPCLFSPPVFVPTSGVSLSVKMDLWSVPVAGWKGEKWSLSSAPRPVSSSSFSLAPQPLFQWETSAADYHELSVGGTPPSEEPGHSSPQPWTPSTKTVVSVGCQTEDEAFFPQMQAGLSFLFIFFFFLAESCPV